MSLPLIYIYPTDESIQTALQEFSDPEHKPRQEPEVSFSSSNSSLTSRTTSTSSVSFIVDVRGNFPKSGTESSLKSRSENSSQRSNPTSALKKGRFSSSSSNSSLNDHLGVDRFQKSTLNQNVHSKRAAMNLSDLYTMKFYDECMTRKVKAHNQKLHKQLKAKIREGNSIKSGGKEGKLTKEIIPEKSTLSYTAGAKYGNVTDRSSCQNMLHEGCPAADEVNEHGPILCRYAGASLVMHQRWQPRYWARVGSASILIFRDENEFKVWTQSRKSKLVKKEFNFDTVSVLRQHASKHSKDPTTSQAVRIFKYKMDWSNEQNRFNSRTLKISKKTPKQVSSFILQVDTDAGIYPVVLFASTDVIELDALKCAVLNCMEYCIHKYTKSPNRGESKKSDKKQKRSYRKEHKPLEIS